MGVGGGGVGWLVGRLVGLVGWLGVGWGGRCRVLLRCVSSVHRRA